MEKLMKALQKQKIAADELEGLLSDLRAKGELNLNTESKRNGG